MIGLPLPEAIAQLTTNNCSFSVLYTVPTRDFFPVDESICYVIRQQCQTNGTYLLTVAAKMRKEVC